MREGSNKSDNYLEILENICMALAQKDTLPCLLFQSELPTLKMVVLPKNNMTINIYPKTEKLSYPQLAIFSWSLPVLLDNSGD